MTMENKYYTPSIEEFHKGFNYEFLDTFGDWTSDFKDLFYWESLPKDLEQGKIRVKYLDRKDVLSTVFVSDITKEFQKPDLVVCETTEKSCHSYYKLVYSIKNRHLELYDCEDDLLFTGTIKNKSEFKQILQWTGILK